MEEYRAIVTDINRDRGYQYRYYKMMVSNRFTEHGPNILITTLAMRIGKRLWTPKYAVSIKFILHD